MVYTWFLYYSLIMSYIVNNLTNIHVYSRFVRFTKRLLFPACPARSPTSAPYRPRPSAVQLGKQTGEERNPAAAGSVLPLASLWDFFYCLYFVFVRKNTYAFLSNFLLSYKCFVILYQRNLVRIGWILLAWKHWNFFSPIDNGYWWASKIARTR